MGYSSNQQFIAILSSLYALSVRLEFCCKKQYYICKQYLIHLNDVCIHSLLWCYRYCNHYYNIEKWVL